MTIADDAAVRSPDDGDDGFDTDAFLAGLDAILSSPDAGARAEDYLLDAMTAAENAGDLPGLLAVLNETMGFYRSRSRHRDNQWIIQRAIELALRMGLEGTEAWTTTLINAATSQRAAGNHEQAEELYEQALDSAGRVFAPDDRRLAALRNNRSLLFAETGRPARARRELREALRILERSSVDPTRDVDIASSATNLALQLLRPDDAGKGPDAEALREARELTARALRIYRDAGAEDSAHYASALAGHAQTAFAMGDFDAAVDGYTRALAIIAERYGEDTDYHAVTAHNLEQALAARDEARRDGRTHAAADARADAASTTAPADVPPVRAGTPAPDATPLTGLRLARDYWLACVRPMIAERYPDHVHRIAAGLVGHGSECYGFDDALSRDHDFGPRVCLWLTPGDFARIGADLQRDYDALPDVFHGVSRSEATPRARGEGRRDGVFEIGAFFTSITGGPVAPGSDEPHLWLALDEATLAAATNGRVFADALGAFSKARRSFRLMPDDVRLSLVSRRLGMIAQAGQYNLPRMLERGDGAAAWLCVERFADAVSSLVFLLNDPATVGYAPYYKWRFAGLRALSRRAGRRLTDVCARLERLLRVSSAACFGGAGFGEGGAGARPNVDEALAIVDAICRRIVEELRAQGLTESDAVFLEWQRPYVESHIVSDAACLRSL